MLAVQTLCRVAHLKPMVSGWLRSEWPDWYADGGAGDLKADVDAFARSDAALPVGLVVFRDAEPVGFGALKHNSISTHRHLAPWAAAGFVLPDQRGHGIGTFLLQAIVAHAKGMGLDTVYCGTSTANTLLERAGWHQIEQIIHAGQPLSIYSRT